MSDPFYYKIRNLTGRYSTGGSFPRFTKDGKTWRTETHLKAHLARVAYPSYYDNCHIVSFTVSEASCVPVSSLVQTVAKAKRAKADARAKTAKREKERAERQQLAELQAKYPDKKENK